MEGIFEFRGLKGAAVPPGPFRGPGGRPAERLRRPETHDPTFAASRTRTSASHAQFEHAGGPDGPARQGGGRARWTERRRLFNTLTVAGGRATSARTCIGPPQLGHSRPATPIHATTAAPTAPTSTWGVTVRSMQAVGARQRRCARRRPRRRRRPQRCSWGSGRPERATLREGPARRGREPDAPVAAEPRTPGALRTPTA